jgi:hypothetical protein
MTMMTLTESGQPVASGYRVDVSPVCLPSGFPVPTMGAISA